MACLKKLPKNRLNANKTHQLIAVYREPPIRYKKCNRKKLEMFECDSSVNRIISGASPFPLPDNLSK